MTAELYVLGANETNDIPAMLRRMAESIEKGEFGDVRNAAFVIARDDGPSDLFGWGPDLHFHRLHYELCVAANNMTIHNHD